MLRSIPLVLVTNVILLLSVPYRETGEREALRRPGNGESRVSLYPNILALRSIHNLD